MGFQDDDPIWYAAYGSNCLSSRFGTYLHGGRAEGAATPEPGARDPRPPHRSEACWFPQSVRYLGDSSKWSGGGIAFLDHAGGGRSPGRRYLITKGQFDDVTAQESRRGVQSIPVERLTPGLVTPFGDGAYDGVLLVDDIDGVPVVTFTSPEPRVDEPVTAPSPSYFGTIVRGLLEVHAGLDDIVDALLASPGVGRGWNATTIAALATK